MALIDEVAASENITKATVITRALDCLKVSFDAGNHGLPMTGGAPAVDNSAELEELRAKLARYESGASESSRSLTQAEERADRAQRDLQSAESRADRAERDKESAQERADRAQRAQEAAEARVEELQKALAQAEQRADELSRSLAQAESRADMAERGRDDAQRRAQSFESEMHSAVAAAKAQAVAAAPSAQQLAEAAANEQELRTLRELVAKNEAALDEKSRVISAKEAEISAKNATIEERNSRIAELSEQLGNAKAKIDLAKSANEVKAVMVGDAPAPADEDTERALYMFNMLGGVMTAFQQQVTDARIVGEQEGRAAVQRELKDMVDKARNEGYRDAMGFLDNRVTSARDAGAREERARIANMGFFEQRRYLKMHLA